MTISMKNLEEAPHTPLTMRTLIRRVTYPLWLIKEVALAGGFMAWDMLTPRTHLSPRIINYPLRVKGNVEVSIFATSITMTPGTLVLGICRVERPYFLIHAMYGDDRVALLRTLKNMEDRVLLASRGSEWDGDASDWDPLEHREAHLDSYTPSANILRQVAGRR